MVLRMGTEVAGYRIEAVLGSGGMGTVYRAAHPSLPRSDALKVLSSELSQDPQFRSRFMREADLAATLDHPNIVTVHNRGETEDGQLWIAMQYVQGSDADREVQAGRMTPERAVHILSEVAKALDYAHRHHILHRDVKPANFLLAANDERVFLADFGIARARDDAAGLTATGMVMASVAYAAPESLGGDNIDGRADIYSLGCSLFRLLTQKTPFGGSGGMAAMAAAHLSQPVPRVTELVPALPPAIDAVIAKAMAKEPADRYQTATEFAQAAAAALDETTAEVKATPVPRAWPGTPAPAPSAPTGYTPPGYMPPPPPPAYEARTYPSGSFSGPNGPTTLAPHYPGMPAAPPGGKPGAHRRRWIFAVAAVLVVAAAAVAAVFVFGASREPPYQPQTLTHMHGTTQINARPTAVAAVGPGDADAVLALGGQPVVIGGAAGSELSSWEQSAVKGTPRVLGGFLDTAAVAAAKPDVIIATGDIDDATYNKLAAIAPTVTRPQDTQGWTWQTQLKWVGRILGRDGKVDGLINSVRSQQDDLRNQNPAFAGKSIEVVSISNTGVTQTLSPSFTADYLTALGFTYNDKLKRTDVDTGTTRPVANLDDLFSIETDVLIVTRTDSGAGQGGFSGLPTQLTTYKGQMVIVDDPNIIAALADPGGYLASQHLDANLVPAISRQVK